MNETGGSVEGGGGGGFFSTPRVCTADGFICILSQPGLTNMRALSTMESCCCHPSQKKKSKLCRDGCPLSSWKLCLLPVLSTASCQKLGRPQRYAGSQERDTGGKTREKDFTLLSIFKAFDLHSTSPFFAKSN